MVPLKTTNNIAPALTLMVMAPLLTEVLPGATRFSSLFVLPIEICVWGGGALLIRYAVRRWQLGWINMLCLALALAIAEEFLIQQTSLAPMVIRLKGVTYARVLGINYVYLTWALIYEAVFVVFLPIYLVELIFPAQREKLWISKTGFFVVIPLFIIGCLLAWFSWTKIARPKVFHVPAYSPTPVAIIISLAIILGLIFIAFTQFKNISKRAFIKSGPPVSGILIIAGVWWAVLLYGIVVLGFGIAPWFPPLLAVCLGTILASSAVIFLPGWIANERWQSNHQFAIIFGVVLGSMLVSFIGFIDSVGPDLYFKIFINIIAVVLLIMLGGKLKKKSNGYDAIK